jgi:uncharacterized YigZ family protein
MEEDQFTRLKSDGNGLYREKGSKFIAIAFPVENIAVFEEQLSNIRKKHPKARHFCFAYRLSPETGEWRASDDGEPKHSAGTPILRQIQSNLLYYSAVVVIRYFGGTKLGVSGLIQAYKEVAGMAIENAQKTIFFLSNTFTWKLTYSQLDQAMRMIDEFDATIVAQEMTKDVKMVVAVRQLLAERMLREIDKRMLGTLK